jgi:predicted nucleotidyltransferase
VREVPRDDAIVAAVRKALPDVVGIWFYGSAAQGRAGPESDLDIGVLGGARYDFDQLWKATDDLMEELRWEPIDLVDMRDASLLLRFGVVSEGRRLWALDPKAADMLENSAIGMFQRDRVQRSQDIATWLERFRRGFDLTGAGH